MLVKAYGYSYNIPYIITRGNNVYGPTQFPEKVVPKFLCLVQRGEKLPIHGDGSSMRSFLYIDDVARAFDVVLHRGVEREVYNISTTFERTVKDVAKDILDRRLPLVVGVSRSDITGTGHVLFRLEISCCKEAALHNR